jgi:hypothetical protein
MKKLLPFLLLLLAPISHAQCGGGGTHTLASYASATLQACLSSVNTDGTIITYSGNGSATWGAGAIVWTQTNSVTIQGLSTVVGNCTPLSTSCVTTDNSTITISGGGSSVLSITTLAGKSFRWTGTTLLGPSGGTAAFGQLNIGGGSTAVRLDHLHINDQINGDHFFQLNGWNGVIDHSFFDSTNQSNLFFMQITNTGASGYGHEAWAAPDAMGTSVCIYLENDVFQNGTFVYDTNFGGSACLRFSIVGPITRLQTHGTGSAGPVDAHRGGRKTEDYFNTLNYGTGSPGGSFSFVIDFESGVGMFFQNVSTLFNNFVQAFLPRNTTSPYTQSNSGWGACASSPIAGISGPSPWDQNTSGQNGYACLDQVGRGQGQLITGCFVAAGFGCTGTLNSVTGTQAWTNEALSPIYAWLNTVNQVPSTTTTVWEPSTGVVQKNRDYYLGIPNLNDSSTFNGTVGVGQGTLASAPGTCTKGVGYWATDQGSWNTSGNGVGNGVLYVCGASNNFMPYYTPFTYPHPLVTGGGGGGTVIISPNTATCPSTTLGTPIICQTFTLSNSNASPATSLSITFAGTNPTEFTQTNNCGTTLAGSSSCTIVASFVPLNIGSRTAQLQCQATIGGIVLTPATALLTGTGLSVPPAPANMFSMTGSGTLTMANFCKPIANQTQLCCGTDGCGESKNGGAFNKFLSGVTLSPGTPPSIATQ